MMRKYDKTLLIKTSKKYFFASQLIVIMMISYNYKISQQTWL